jgi:putative transposase
MPISPLMKPRDHAEEVALFRSEIIGQLGRSELVHGELRRELRALSQKRFRPPQSHLTRSYSIATLERWLYAYRAGGLDALRPGARSDKGRARHLDDSVRELILDIRREHSSASVPLILRTLVADGRMTKDAVSPSTVRRLFQQEGLDRIPMRDGGGQKTRLRWQAERPNALWHADVCHGPALVIHGVSRPLRIHALLDDASRYIVAIEAHHQEREIEMLGLFVRALRRNAAPDVLYLDNGSTYIGDALRIGCERLGITLLHARPYDAPARGKMERFWRTLREGCVDFLGSLTSLHDVNVRLCAFVDEHYHKAPHGSLMGKSPGAVYAPAAGDPTKLLTESQLHDALTVRERRRVRRDTTISMDGTDWELDQGFLAGRIVTVARSLIDTTSSPWVEHEEQRLPLHAVDPISNARRTRPPRRQTPPTTRTENVPFDPPTALLDRAARRRSSPTHRDKGGRT